MRSTQRPKIVIEFDGVAAALEWFDQLRDAGFVPEDTDLFVADGLDMSRVEAGTLTVRRVGDRPDRFTVRANIDQLLTPTERRLLGDRRVEKLAATVASGVGAEAGPR